MPRVSVVIATYNRATLVAEAVRSVRAQNYRDIEIIVADDGSTDDTQARLAQFGDGILCLRLPHRGQPAATRNAGLRHATGDFVALLDSDDLFLPNKLDLQVAALLDHPQEGLVYSNGHLFHDDPAVPVGHLLDGLPTPSGEVFPELLRGNFLSTPTVLIRRTCLDEVGFYDERPGFFAVEDYDLWLRLAARFPVLYIPGEVAAVRLHGHNISHDVSALHSRMLDVLAKNAELYPGLIHSNILNLYEGYARHHGGIALGSLKTGDFRSVFHHAGVAISYTLRLPGFGLGALVDWHRRSRSRTRLAR